MGNSEKHSLDSSSHTRKRKCQSRFFLSRHFLDQMEWKLNPHLFQEIVHVLFHPQVDLFASRLNYQLPKYVSYQPDPTAWKTDALSIPWKNPKAYAFLPFNLIPQFLQKVRRDNPLIILVTPFWTTQPWYPKILQMSCDNQILLPRMEKMINLPYEEDHAHPLKRPLQLIAWTVCGDSTRQMVFQQNKQTFLAMHAGINHQTISILMEILVGLVWRQELGSLFSLCHKHYRVFIKWISKEKVF